MKKGDIWITEYPVRDGREQSGKRPSIVVADTDANVVVVIPLTSNLESLEKFSNTIKIIKSNVNGLDWDSVALAFQIQVLDKNNFISRIGDLENNYLDQINKNLKQLLQL